MDLTQFSSFCIDSQFIKSMIQINKTSLLIVIEKESLYIFIIVTFYLEKNVEQVQTI